MSAGSGQLLDMAQLVLRAREWIAGAGPSRQESFSDPDRLAGYRERMAADEKARNPVVLAQDTAVELGSPRRASVHALLWTEQRDLIRHRLLTRIGPDLPELTGQERDYAQVLMLAVQPGVEWNPFRLEPIQFLTHRLPGVMARTIPGRLWLRVSREAIAAGLDFEILAGTLAAACQDEIPAVESVECLLVTSNRAEVESLFGLSSEARIYSGRHQKIALAAGGDYECEELDCPACDEKPVCDQIREVAEIRRRARPGRGESR